MRTLKSEFRSKEEELELRDLVLKQKWLKEDEQLKLQRDLRSEKLNQMYDEQKMAAVHEEMQKRLQRLYLEREAKIIEVERGRAARIAKEQAEEAMESSKRSFFLQKKTELSEASIKAAAIAETGLNQAESTLMITIEEMREESNQILERERLLAKRQQEIDGKATEARVRQEWTRSLQSQLEDVVETEANLQLAAMQLRRSEFRGDDNPVMKNDKQKDYDVAEISNQILQDNRDRRSTAEARYSPKPKWTAVPVDIPDPNRGRVGYGISDFSKSKDNYLSSQK